MNVEVEAVLVAFGLNTFAWLAMTFVTLRIKADLSTFRAHIAENYVSKDDLSLYLKRSSHHVA